MQVEKVEGFTLEDLDTVSMSYQGNVIEVKYLEKRNAKATVRTLDKDHFVEVASGEIKDYEHHDNRSFNEKSLKRTFARLRALINTNCTDPAFCRWCTLTYKENMTDPAKLYTDFRYFIDRLCYYCEKRGIERPEYISVVEPQARGAWHCHLLLIWDTVAPFIANVDLANLWKKGFVRINALDDVDNIGAYLTAYLCDMEIPNCEGSAVKNVILKNGKSKSFIKGGRLFMYPPDMCLYRHSIGIKEPETDTCTYYEAKEKVKGAALTYSTTIRLSDEDNDFQTIVHKEYYNTKRKT